MHPHTSNWRPWVVRESAQPAQGRPAWVEGWVLRVRTNRSSALMSRAACGEGVAQSGSTTTHLKVSCRRARTVAAPVLPAAGGMPCSAQHRQPFIHNHPPLVHVHETRQVGVAGREAAKRAAR